jgi:predicted flap endonuclease-1-like 5' DNA nuclease
MSEASTQGTIIRKTAYATVGLPAHLVSQMKDRLMATRETLDDFRGRISEEAGSALEEWIEEGERIITALGERARSIRDDLEHTVEKRAEGARDIGRGLSATLMEPIVAIDEIDGIGPAYAAKLAEAGVISTRALVERCSTKDAIERLSDQTGISVAMLDKWLAAADLTRINGVGSEHMSLLNGLGIATIESLAEENPADLAKKATDFHDQHLLEGPIPSRETFADWIAQARALL